MSQSTVQDLLAEFKKGNVKTIYDVRNIIRQYDENKNSALLADMVIMDALGKLDVSALLKTYLKIYKNIETFENEANLEAACRTAVQELVKISSHNQKIKEDYHVSYNDWYARRNDLLNKKPSKNQGDYPEFYTPCRWGDRDGLFREDCKTGWHNYKWAEGVYRADAFTSSDGTSVEACGLGWVRGRCVMDVDKNYREWESSYNNLLSQEPTPPVYENLPNINCLSCKQDLSIGEGNTIDVDELKQVINCSINEDKDAEGGGDDKTGSTGSTGSTDATTGATATLMEKFNEYKTYLIIGLVILILVCCGLSGLGVLVAF